MSSFNFLKSTSFGLQISWVFDYSFSFDFDLIFYSPSFDFFWFAGLKLYFFMDPSSFGLKDREWPLLRCSQGSVKETLLQPTLC